MHTLEETQGLNLSVLKTGTKLYVETRNSFYELRIVEGKQVEIFGGTRHDGSTRYAKPTNVIFHGSTWGGSSIKVDWLGIDMHMEFGVDGRKTLTTSGVKRIEIESPDGNWSYALG
jgi:hypothetical protein